MKKPARKSGRQVPQTKVARLNRQLIEARNQLSASTEVLQLISSASVELSAVFQAVLEKALKRCEADFGFITTYDGERFSPAAQSGVPDALAEYFSKGMDQPRGGEAHARLLAGENLVQNLDQKAEEAYRKGSPLRRAIVDLGGVRSALVVALRNDGVLLGALTIYRKEVRAFTKRQIALLQNFAAQASVAIANARLFDNVQARTRDLSEALTHQTASAKVLRVIASSPADIRPVLNSIIESACELCKAYDGIVRLRVGDRLYSGSHVGHIPANEEVWPITGESVSGRAILEGRPVHVHDMQSLEGDAFPESKERARHLGHRTILSVPLLRNEVGVGVIILRRIEVNPFSEKQIAHLQTFADQAVIAIENARLFNETKEALDRQTATADILKVIASSPADVQPVFDAIVKAGLNLFPSSAVVLALESDGFVRAAAIAENDAKLADMLQQAFPVPLTREFLHAAAILDSRCIDIPDAQVGPDEFFSGCQNLLSTGHQAITIMPMMGADQSIGVLSVVRRNAGSLSDRQMELLKTFADQAVIAIENARLLREIRQRTGELEVSLQQQTATADILRTISQSPTEVQPVFDSIVLTAIRLIGCETAFILRRDGDCYTAVSAANSEGLYQAFGSGSIPINPNANFPSRAIVQKRNVYVPDWSRVELPEHERIVRDRRGFNCALYLPLLRDDECIGVLGLASKQSHSFDENQIKLAESFRDQALISIENARLFNETRDALERQTATADVLDVISRSTTDTAPVFSIIGERAEKLCDAEISVVSVLEDQQIKVAGIRGISDESVELFRKHFPMPLDRQTVTARVIKSGEVIHIGDVLSDTHYENKDLAKQTGYRSCLGVPMHRDDKVIGAIFVARAQAGRFADNQIQLLKIFADQAVIAIENARLFNQIKARTEELNESLQQQTATADVLKVISRSAFDLQTVLHTLVESAVRLAVADKGTITRMIDGQFYRAESIGFSSQFMDYVRTIPVRPERGSATGRALLEGVAVHILDAKADPDFTFTEAQKYDHFRTMLSVPLLRDGQPLGVITLVRTEVRPFTQKQIELVTTFADQAAIAIENVRLFEEVQSRTRELSRSLEDLRLAQDRLVQTEKLASLGQLTAGIAHEIKNPLNFVNNFSSLSGELIDELKDTLTGVELHAEAREEIDQLTQTLKSNLVKVVQHGRRADSIVKNMLLHSREGSGEQRQVEINAIIDESLNLAYHGARAEKSSFHITLERKLDPEAGQVDVFPQEISRVLLNIISNGFYAAMRRSTDTANGFEPMLSAETRNLGANVEIRIRDNGTGIPPEVKEKIFTPFFTTKPPGEGTGLGLSMSYDIIVKQHGGRIDVESEPNSFTEFVITLPRQAANKKNGSPN